MSELTPEDRALLCELLEVRAWHKHLAALVATARNRSEAAAELDAQAAHCERLLAKLKE